jgi:hypothetical protein
MTDNTALVDLVGEVAAGDRGGLGQASPVTGLAFRHPGLMAR